MVKNNTLSINVKFDRDVIYREFDSSYKNSQFGSAFTTISKNPEFVNLLADTFAEVHGIKSETIEEILLEEVFKDDDIFGLKPVPWYLNEFYSAVRQKYNTNSHSEYLLTVKACRDFYFYKLEEKIADKEQLVHKPFFQKATPTKEPKNIRGLADTVLFLAPKLKNLAKKDELLAFISWFNIKLHCSVKELDTSRNTFILTISPDIDSSKYISLPPTDERILVASPNVRKAIADLSEVWLNPTAKSILLSAWTGSGKEVLFNLLTDAMHINRNNRLVRSAPEIAKFQELKKLIQEKLCTKGQRSILFLDEIHHDAAADIRPSILRLIESDTLENVGGETFDCKSILYILATSLPPEKVRIKNPPDLWTRMEYTVKINHPLLVKSDDEREETLREYFLMFWDKQKNRWEQSDEKDIITKMRIDDSLVKQLSDEFVDELGSPLIPLISIRILRTIVKRLFSRTVSHLRISVHGEETLKDEFRKWIKEIFNELVSDIDTRGLF